MDEISHSDWIMKTHLNARRTFTFCRWMHVIVVCVCFFLSFSKWLNIQSRINLNSNKWTIRVASWAWASIILYILRTILDSFEMWCVFYRSVFHDCLNCWDVIVIRDNFENQCNRTAILVLQNHALCVFNEWKWTAFGSVTCNMHSYTIIRNGEGSECQ